uniref:Seipin n=1 Tax=Leersia perrieri TaxID=77586 RepID=A0A0D9XWX3_9ORYZ
MDSSSKYHHHDYPFLPAETSVSGDDDGFFFYDSGEPRNPTAGSESTDDDAILFLAVPAGWLVRLVAIVGEIIASAILSVIHPFAALIGRLRAIKSEAISASGITIATTTQPYMIRYRSSSIRLMQNTLLSLPLTMGILSESQSANLKLLYYREGHGRHKRTSLIRVMLQPRAMTVHLPQVYKAEIIVQTSLPWMKELIRASKWTLCVWVSLSVYVFILVLAICCVRVPSVFSTRDRRLYDHRQVIETSDVRMRDLGERSNKRLSRDLGERFKWKERIRKRKAQHGPLQGDRMELKFTEGSTSGVTVEALAG